MIEDYENLLVQLPKLGLGDWDQSLRNILQDKLVAGIHGDLPRWRQALENLPSLSPSSIDLSADTVRIGTNEDCDQETREQLYKILQEFHPWRKGPFEIFGIHIDTEWRSDWKWQRLKDHIAALNGKQVLDVGCGNGYYAWRMRGAGAKRVIGIDPTMAFIMQYHAIKKYMPEEPVYVIPAGIDDLPQVKNSFDSVFSMGVIYHRKDPLQHLNCLKEYLRPGGELVLETLVIEGQKGDILKPDDRYARMRNVWQIPAVATAEDWLLSCGMNNIRCVDVSRTTIDEQRSTDWMRFESLDKCLDPDNPLHTVEGYPTPIRAVFTANKN